jgi:hypothetical protein
MRRWVCALLFRCFSHRSEVPDYEAKGNLNNRFPNFPHHPPPHARTFTTIPLPRLTEGSVLEGAALRILRPWRSFAGCVPAAFTMLYRRRATALRAPKSTRKNRKRNVRGLNEERKRCVGRTGHILKQRHENVKVVWRLKTVRAGCRAQKSYNPKTGLKDFGILRW